MIREADRADIPELMEMIIALAEHHDKLDAVSNTPERLQRTLFIERPPFTVHVIEAPAESGRRLNGFSLWFPTYSSWDGTLGMQLLDLYVRPESRGTGAGRQLLENLARIAIAGEYRRIEWQVAKTNVGGAEFYRAMGATVMDEWDIYELRGEALERLASA